MHCAYCCFLRKLFEEMIRRTIAFIAALAFAALLSTVSLVKQVPEEYRVRTTTLNYPIGSLVVLKPEESKDSELDPRDRVVIWVDEQNKTVQYPNMLSFIPNMKRMNGSLIGMIVVANSQQVIWPITYCFNNDTTDHIVNNNIIVRNNSNDTSNENNSTKQNSPYMINSRAFFIFADDDDRVVFEPVYRVAFYSLPPFSYDTF
ncbi:hypothetical protein HELRODRAFT_160988 [Helobdella robusta]|uniref:Uncharacterized protein n=1 Tax=Helobdella robusta TaxID=6412 RepID=T1EQY9_HELRO|nr:hypothetical protein HELRODRAFT_160988 [Helobdella robusta]ESO01819.1 hypothetical protein HELRODRAFT_160988 [Helobdella robusta]